MLGSCTLNSEYSKVIVCLTTALLFSGHLGWLSSVSAINWKSNRVVLCRFESMAVLVCGYIAINYWNQVHITSWSSPPCGLMIQELYQAFSDFSGQFKGRMWSRKRSGDGFWTRLPRFKCLEQEKWGGSGNCMGCSCFLWNGLKICMFCIMPVAQRKVAQKSYSHCQRWEIMVECL